MTDVDRVRRDVKILRDHNEWRRGSTSYEATDPKKLGVALETAIECMEKLIIVSEG